MRTKSKLQHVQKVKRKIKKWKVFVRNIPVKSWDRQVLSLKHASSVPNKHKMESVSAIIKVMQMSDSMLYNWRTSFFLVKLSAGDLIAQIIFSA